MHKRKGALVNSSALVSLKLCIFFCLFLSFSALFILFIFFSAFLPLFYLSLSFSIPFPPSLILSASYLCFIPLLPFIYLLYPFCSFWPLLFLSLFIPLIYLSIFPFTFHSCLVLFPYYLFYPCSCLLYLCVFPLLYLLLFRCSDYSSDVSISL